jgi:hypothetical protein
VPPEEQAIHECIILKAFVDQKECIKQLKDKDTIKKIAGTYFSFPRVLVELEDHEARKNYIDFINNFNFLFLVS